MEITQTVSTSSIFFDYMQKHDVNRQEGLRKAKVTLIEDVAKIRGVALSPVEFNELYDLDIDELHSEVIKAQDQRYFSANS